MRVDLVITELFVGGAERCLTQLALGLHRAGDQVRVFSIGRLPTGPQRQLVDQLEAAGIEVRSAAADRSWQSISALRQLKLWLRSTPADICQSFLFHANVLAALALRKQAETALIGGIRVAEARPLRLWIEGKACRSMRGVVCVSNSVADFASRRLGCPADQRITIPNGVDVDRFATAHPADWRQFDWPADAIVSLFIGRLHPQKGIHLLQSQVDSLAPKHSRRKLLLVGEGPLRHDVADWAQSVGPDRVRLLPWQPDVAPLIRAARVLVLPSYYEGMPNVVMEAMAAAKPVVYSRAEGSQELLAESIHQQSFPIGDASAMQQLVEPFLADESWADQMGAANQSRVQNQFSIESMVTAYRSFYSGLLD